MKKKKKVFGHLYASLVVISITFLNSYITFLNSYLKKRHFSFAGSAVAAVGLSSKNDRRETLAVFKGQTQIINWQYQIISMFVRPTFSFCLYM